METLEQSITRGSIVESRQHGWQGIVTTVAPNFWALIIGEESPSADRINEYRKWNSVLMPTDEVLAEQWVSVSDFSYDSFTLPLSDLITIPMYKVRFSEFPCAFHGKIFSVDTVEGDVVLTLKTNRSHHSTCTGYSDVLLINNATVVPYPGDLIFGTQDVAIIRADGLNYPYRLSSSVLKQDW